MYSLKTQIFILFFVISCVIIAGHTEFQRGRINMCHELGNLYLEDGECIGNSEYQMKYNNSNKYKTFNINNINNQQLDLLLGD
jgi:hypothetical protein